MQNPLKVVECRKPETQERKVVSAETYLRHFRNITGSLLQDAHNTWEEIWRELEGSVVEKVMVLPDAREGFKPACGWPEFLEKMWTLKHYIDHAKRIAEGRA